MRILINAVAKAKGGGLRGGGLRHLANLLPSLAKVDIQKEYLVYVNKYCTILSNIGNLKIIPLDFPNRSYIHRLIWDQKIVNRLAKKHNAILIFSLCNYGTIYPRVKQIVCQNSPAFCDYYFQKSNSKKKIRMNLRRINAYLTMKASEKVIVPTEAWRDIIMKHCPHIPKEKFIVIPHGFDRERFSHGRELPPDVEKKLKAYENAGIKLLLTCHPNRHKGFELLFQALRIVHKQADFALFLTVKPNNWYKGIRSYKNIIKGLEENIVTLGSVPQDSIVNLYRKADIFVFPSLCESFGFSMVEAMGLGLPIIASDTAVNREICGEAALYFNPYNVNDVAEKMLLMLKDKKLREELRQKALKRSQEFPTWDEVARKTLEVIEEVAARA